MIFKKAFNLLRSNDVNANDQSVVKTDIVAPGKKIIIKTFRGCIPSIGDGIDALATLEWGSLRDFEIIAIGCWQFDYVINEVRTGDGMKFLRLVRSVPYGPNNRKIFAQVRGFYKVL